jgi:hypothetical protein
MMTYLNTPNPNRSSKAILPVLMVCVYLMVALAAAWHAPHSTANRSGSAESVSNTAPNNEIATTIQPSQSSQEDRNCLLCSWHSLQQAYCGEKSLAQVVDSFIPPLPKQATSTSFAPVFIDFARGPPALS